MSLEVIKNENYNLQPEEERILNKIKNLYSSIENQSYLYVNFKIGNATPKFLLIDANRGIAIINVKLYNSLDIEEINEDIIKIKGVEEENPIYKTESDADIIRGIIKNTQPKIKKIKNNIFLSTILLNLTKKEVEEKELREYFEQGLVQCIYKENFNQLTLSSFFRDNMTSLTNQDIVQIRVAMFPELKINKSIQSTYIETTESVIALDKDQESFAKRVPYGHYMVTGVPGSGKTVILIARAIYLIKEHPEWKIAILTYNKSLENKINEQIEAINNEFEKNKIFMGQIKINHIQVKTFHSLAYSLVSNARELYQSMKKDKQEDEFWKNTLPNLALLNAQPQYDAILIDEYQDFRDNWIQLCIKLCKKHLYTKGSKTEEVINLFMAGDRLQSIYNKKIQNWSKLGINMRGRSKLLKTTYRTGKASTKLALKFLEQTPELKKEVATFYKEEGESKVEIHIAGNEGEVQFKQDNIVSILTQLILKEHYDYKDILIIYPTERIGNNLLASVPYEMKIHMKKVKEQGEYPVSDKILMCTYHSSKGLEAKVVILVEVDHFNRESDPQKDILQRKLIYVGMTRASEKLIIQANDFITSNLASEIKQLIE